MTYCFNCKEITDKENRCVNPRCRSFGKILYSRDELQKRLEKDGDPVKIDDKLFEKIKKRMELGNNIAKKWK